MTVNERGVGKLYPLTLCRSCGTDYQDLQLTFLVKIKNKNYIIRVLSLSRENNI